MSDMENANALRKKEKAEFDDAKDEMTKALQHPSLLRKWWFNCFAVVDLSLQPFSTSALCKGVSVKGHSEY